MASKLPINRNTDEWELPKEIADRVLSAVEAIESGQSVRTVEFITKDNGEIVRLTTEVDGSETREVLNEATAARLKSGLSQAAFAQLTGISVRTLQEWEQGRRKPSSAARSLLKIVIAKPKLVQEILSA